MLNWKQKMTAGAATAAAAFSLLTTGAFASTDVQVSGNGAFSDSNVDVNQSHSTTVDQSNTTNVNNNITNVANTGGVFAGFNTGGDIDVRTGDADARTDVRVEGGSNTANIEGCCNGLTDVKVSGNGAFSENDVDVESDSDTTVRQTNRTDVDNDITNVANTGGVFAGFNTGGDIDVETGDARAETRVEVDGGRNHLDISGGNSNGGTDVTVSGNGAFSDNDIDVDTDSDVDVRQSNRTDVDNDITNVANTGGVSTGFNTGGDVEVRTGDADARTDVRVEGNTNELDLEGCALCGSGSTDIWVSGNGAFSDTDVRVNSDHDKDVRQDNRTDTTNNTSTVANTGGVFTSGYGGKHWYDRDKHDYDQNHNDLYRKFMDKYDHMMYKMHDDYDRNHHGNKKQNDYGYHQKYDDFDKKDHKNYGDSKDRDYKNNHDFKFSSYDKPSYDHDKKDHSKNKYSNYYKNRYVSDNRDKCDRDNNKKYGYMYDQKDRYGMDYGKKGYDRERDNFKNAWGQWYMNNYYPDDVFGGHGGVVFAGFNTGGDVTIRTGDATAETRAFTTGNSNVLRS